MNQPVAETAYGPVRGADDGTAVCWKGVRYAAPPVGELRFRAPQPPAPWTEPADATRFGRTCPQPPVPNFPMNLGAGPDEDCLFLNVWAPSGTTAGDAKAVLVWVHGGAYVLGSGSQPYYDGRRLASAGDVVVVTLNYRLGAFGFLDLPGFDSNVGLRDVLAALRWVRDNIAAFGGDPGRVTVFGESAGGGIVTTLLRSLLAGLVAAVWTVVTVMVMPAIVLEGLGATAAIKRSAGLIRSTWGEALLGSVRIGARFGFLYILPGFLLIVGGVVLAIAVGGAAVAGGVLLIIIGLGLVLWGSVLAATCRNVFGVALFRWTTGEGALGPFSEADLQGAVRTRG